MVNVNLEKGGSFDSYLSSYVKLSPLKIVMEPDTHREVSLDAFRNLNGSLQLLKIDASMNFAYLSGSVLVLDPRITDIGSQNLQVVLHNDPAGYIQKISLTVAFNRSNPNASR